MMICFGIIEKTVLEEEKEEEEEEEEEIVLRKLLKEGRMYIL